MILWGLVALASVLVIGMLVRLITRLTRAPEDPLPFWSIAFSPDGKTIVTGGGEAGRQIGGLPGEIIFWNLATGKKHVFPQRGSVRRVVWSQDGSAVAIGTLSGNIKLVRPLTGEPVLNFSPPIELLNGIALSNDGKLIVGAGTDGSIELWDSSGNEKQTIRHDQARFVDVALTPDGHSMVATSLNGKALLFDLTQPGSDPAVLNACDDNLKAECVAFAPDGLTFATGAEKTLRIWETRTGRQQADIVNTAPLNCLAFSPDGGFLAAVDAEGELSLRNPHTGELINATSAHDSTAFGLTISPDSKRIATAARGDYTLKIWQVPTLKLLNSFQRPKPGNKN